MRWKAFMAVALVLSMTLAACNGEPDPAPVDPTPAPPDAPPGENGAALGEEIFTGAMPAAQPACTQCHTVGVGDLIGPDLGGVATRAQERVAELTAREYLEQAIVDPEAYVVEGFQPGIMPGGYSDQLSAEELDALVAYLMTLE